MHFKDTFGPALVSLGLLFGCSSSSDSDAAKIRNQPPPIRVKDQALMDRAVAKARDTQSEFIAALSKMGPLTDRFAIKKDFPTPDETGESIWLSKVAWDGEAYTADVDNNPVYTKAVKLHERVTVKPEEISDWMYFENGELRGGYSLRVLYHEASPAEQAEMKKQMPFDISAVDF